jgi:hypothetical protein
LRIAIRTGWTLEAVRALTEDEYAMLVHLLTTADR